MTGTDSHEITRTELERSKTIPCPAVHPRVGHKEENPLRNTPVSHHGHSPAQRVFGTVYDYLHEQLLVTL